MPEVIRNGRVERDDWRFLDLPGPARAAPASEEDPQLAAERLVVPLAAWKQRREQLLRNLGSVGVWLGPADDPAQIAADLDTLPLVAIHFPKFVDGRGYSSAVLLRRLGYRGELRAIGDVGRDQLSYLGRCGFDAFWLAPHRDAHAALASLGGFSVRYQGSVDDPLPLFRRRLAPGGSLAQRA